ncbi:MAG: site-2 protease family protein [Candidatus Aenigmarchaeota archaeon]|nr:site-2 protease family protein [Candidatus Aenigmarchaeota archaeon]
MDLQDLLITNFWYIVLAVFLVGTILLMKTKHQRWFIIFMIKTQHGIKLLERLGSLSPGFWRFLGDLAVIVSFGGLGTLYVSRYRKVWPFLLLLGLFSMFFILPLAGPALTGGLFLALLLALFILNKIPERFASKVFAVLTVLIIFSIFLGFAGTLRPGTPALAISIITGIFGLPGLLVGALGSQAAAIITQESALPGISPLLPGISSEGQVGFMFPGLDIFIPLWSGLIAIIILLVSHEFSHGIMARVQKIPVKTMGLLTVGIVPVGAFVEPDDKVLEKKKSEEKMRVYAMGSFANLIVAGLATILLLGVSVWASGMVEPVGIEIFSVQEGFPAEVLEPGTVIQKINGISVSSMEEYLTESAKLKPGDIIKLDTDRGSFSLKSVSNPGDSSRAYLGFNLRTKTSPKEGFENQQSSFGFLLAAGSALEIIFFLNLNIAIVNLLPVIPFDGSKMFDELLKSFRRTRRHRKRISGWVWKIVLLLLLVNALPLFRILAEALGAAVGQN